MNPYIDITLRSVAVYFFMIIAFRIFGKKELSQLNTADVILILLISNSVQNAMVGANTSLYGGIIAAFSLFLINFIFKKVKKKIIFLLLLNKIFIIIGNVKNDKRETKSTKTTIINSYISTFGIEVIIFKIILT